MTTFIFNQDGRRAALTAVADTNRFLKIFRPSLTDERTPAPGYRPLSSENPAPQLDKHTADIRDAEWDHYREMETDV
jgi:hypothetical protein